MEPRADLEDYAREQVERLDRLYDGIVDCRVLLEASDSARRVVIELGVPGERLVSSHQSDAGTVVAPDADRPAIPESRWLHALHEGFEAARRILQDHVGRRRTRTRRPRRLAGEPRRGVRAPIR
jgi:hypothetical protein